MFHCDRICMSGLEKADLRCWGLLPREIQVLRTELPAGDHEVHVLPLNSASDTISSGKRVTVSINNGRNHYLIVTAPTERMHLIQQTTKNENFAWLTGVGMGVKASGSSLDCELGKIATAPRSHRCRVAIAAGLQSIPGCNPCSVRSFLPIAVASSAFGPFRAKAKEATQNHPFQQSQCRGCLGVSLEPDQAWQAHHQASHHRVPERFYREQYQNWLPTHQSSIL